MDWEKIIELIPSVVEKVRTDYVMNNMVIKDGIFGILEKHCTVVYYPLEDEKNCGFHIKRFVNDKLEEFVYINTAKTIAEQIFTAAHELGHVLGVASGVWEQLGETATLENELEERIINRFAAELLMPTNEFKKSYYAYIEKLSLAVNKLKVIDLLRIMVFLMNDYMVPYESVRRRLIETEIISSEIGKLLSDNETTILPIINALSKDQNTMLDRVTAKKTIPGLRNMLEKAEGTGKLSIYTLARIKKDFDIAEINENDTIMEVTINGGNYEEN